MAKSKEERVKEYYDELRKLPDGFPASIVINVLNAIDLKIKGINA